MAEKNIKKILAVSTIIVLFLDVILFFTGFVDLILFWVIIIVGAALAFKVIPKMK